MDCRWRLSWLRPGRTCSRQNSLLPRLERRLPLLTGGARSHPARLQTMQDAIAWSYGLLTPAEQVLFRRLSVFVGGFTLAGAEAVSGAWAVELVPWPGRSDQPASITEAFEPSPDVVDGVASLVAKSLVGRRESPVPGRDPEPRFAMLETIREFGIEQLIKSGEADEIRRRHAQYCVALAEAIAPNLQGPDERFWGARLDAELGNLRSAMMWANEVHNAELALRLPVALANYWSTAASPARRARGPSRHWLSPGQLTPRSGWRRCMWPAGPSTSPERTSACVNSRRK